MLLQTILRTKSRKVLITRLFEKADLKLNTEYQKSISKKEILPSDQIEKLIEESTSYLSEYPHNDLFENLEDILPCIPFFQNKSQICDSDFEEGLESIGKILSNKFLELQKINLQKNSKVFSENEIKIEMNDLLEQVNYHKQKLSQFKEEAGVKIDMLMKENSHLIEIKEKMESDIKILAQKNYDLTMIRNDEEYDIVDYETYFHRQNPNNLLNNILLHLKKSKSEETQSDPDKIAVTSIVSKKEGLNFLSRIESDTSKDIQVDPSYNIKFNTNNFTAEESINISINDPSLIKSIVFEEDVFIRLSDKEHIERDLHKILDAIDKFENHIKTHHSNLLSFVSENKHKNESKALDQLLKELNKDFLGSSIAYQDKVIVSNIHQQNHKLLEYDICSNLTYEYSGDRGDSGPNKEEMKQFYRTHTIQEVEEEHIIDAVPQEIEFSIFSTKTEKPNKSLIIKEFEEEKLKNEKIVETAQKMIYHSKGNWLIR